MKKVLFFAIIIAASVTAYAQKAESFQAALGLRAALPIGTTSNAYTFGVGGEFQGEMMFNDNVSGVGSIGYTTFMAKDALKSIGFKSAGMVPVLVGARYYATGNFFVGAKVGYTKFTMKGGSGGFTYEPQVGYNGGKMQASVGYNGISNGGSFTSVGASVLYKF